MHLEFQVFLSFCPSSNSNNNGYLNDNTVNHDNLFTVFQSAVTVCVSCIYMLQCQRVVH